MISRSLTDKRWKILAIMTGGGAINLDRILVLFWFWFLLLFSVGGVGHCPLGYP